MLKCSTNLDYAERVARAVDYIETHLDDDIDLDRLASVACFSPFHFHRIYRGLMQETVAETVRRLRLHRGAVELVERRHPMTRIAARAGYGSVAAFNRAFRAAYGVPPAAFRDLRESVWRSVSQQKDDTMFQVTIRDIAPMHLAALAHTGDYQAIGLKFDRLMAWAGGRGLIGADTRSIGIYYDVPEDVPIDKLRSDACVTVPEGYVVDGDIRVVDLPGGRHAVLAYVGPYADLSQAYHWLFSEWLPKSGEETADRPCFEEYLNNPREHPPSEWRTDICLPLASR